MSLNRPFRSFRISIPIRDRFLGCLLGGAIGDALGAPVEFQSRSEILRSFGPDGITAYAPAYGGIGKITDDTQMTLFTAEGLLRARVRELDRGVTTYSGVTTSAYLRWLRTQGGRVHPDLAMPARRGLALWRVSDNRTDCDRKIGRCVSYGRGR